MQDNFRLGKTLHWSGIVDSDPKCKKNKDTFKRGSDDEMGTFFHQAKEHQSNKENDLLCISV